MPGKPKNHDIVLLRKALGKTLVTARERRHLKQQDVARLVETTRNHLYRMEVGRGDPKLSMLWRLSQVFGLSLRDMMSDVQEQLRELKKAPE